MKEEMAVIHFAIFNEEQKIEIKGCSK